MPRHFDRRDGSGWVQPVAAGYFDLLRRTLNEQSDDPLDYAPPTVFTPPVELGYSATIGWIALLMVAGVLAGDVLFVMQTIDALASAERTFVERVGSFVGCLIGIGTGYWLVKIGIDVFRKLLPR